jgi:flagellar M-ring protein FliF
MKQIFDFYTKLNGGQKAVILGGILILLVFLTFIMVYSKNSNQQNLNHNYTIAKDLNKNEVMIISNELESLSIPFSISGNGSHLTLKTSQEFINIAKIKLVSSGALDGEHKGWELFDKSSIGETSFQNQIKYIRAIEGELSRSLEALSYVKRANIKVVLPKDSIFADKKRNSTASAILTLEQGRYLTANQIKGIKKFISSAVTDLIIENIQIINQDGELLEDAIGGIDEQKFKNQVKYQNKLQAKLERNIIDLLEPAIGQGAVIAKVNILLDFTKQDTYEETYSPEGTVRSKQSDEKVINEEAKSNSKNASSNDLASKAGGNSKKNNEYITTTTNYEISKKVTNTTNKSYAIIKRITAAVTFDDRVLKDNKAPETYMVNIEDLVKDAIGFNPNRDDKITVKSFTFNTSSIESQPAENTVPMIKYYLNEFGVYLKYIIVGLLLFLIYKKFSTFTPATILSSLDANGNPIVTTTTGENQTASNGGVGNRSIDDEIEENINAQQEQAKQKIQNKIKNQLSAFDNLDEESKVKFETLTEQLATDIASNPEAIANMIELILEEELENS